MKNFLLIIILSLILFSCGEKEEAEDDTASAIEASSTASGSITVGSETLSGTYATSCQTAGVSSMASSGSLPSDTKALAWIFVVTGNDNVTEEFHGYTDITCTTKNFHNNLTYDNVSVGSASGSNYQVLQLYNEVELLANTTAAKTWTETTYSVTLTLETELKTSVGPLQEYGLWNLSGTTFQKALTSTSGYPTSLWSIPYTKQ